LLRCFRIFDPALYKGMGTDVLMSFGEVDLARLCGHFCNPLSQKLFEYGGPDGFPAVKAEFRQLKAKLALQAELGKAWEPAYEAIVKDAHLYPRVLQLAYIASVLPVQTACVERGFSRHRLVKTRLSSRKRLITVDAELRVGLLGPPADADAVPLVEAAAELHIKKEKGVAQKLHAAVSGIEVAALGSDADDSEGGSDEASVAGEESDTSLPGQEGEELYESDDEAGGVVLEGGLGLGPKDAVSEEELRALGF
jgi:hypothetical protein